MKNLTFISKKATMLVAVASLIALLNAYPIHKYTRSKSHCLIGCSDVMKDKELKTYMRSDGSLYQAWVIDIRCSGNGLAHCPHMLPPAEQTGIETWSVNIFENLSTYAQTQVDQGVSSGNETYTYVLPDNSTRILQLIWSVTTNAAGEQTVQTDINQLN